MRVGCVAAKGRQPRFKVLGIHLALVRGQREHLVPARLHGPGLVHVDVGGVDRQNPLFARDDAVENRRVGLGAARQKEGLALGQAAGRKDLFLRPRREFVSAVARRLHEVGFSQTAHHLGVGAAHVIGVKVKHLLCPAKSDGAHWRRPDRLKDFEDRKRDRGGAFRRAARS